MSKYRPPISVVLISYYRLDRLQPCVNSILPLLDFNEDDMCIVDNSFATWDPGGNRKLIRNYLTDLASKRQIKLILNEKNNYFSSAVNQGIVATRNEYIFVVNNDVEVIDPLTFIDLVATCHERSDVATVTPVTLQSNGSVYCSGAYGTGAHMTDKPTVVRETEWNNMAFVCIKRSLINKFGMLETGRKVVGNREVNCHHYSSDEEWCRRVSAHGYKHLVNPVQVMHYYKEDLQV